MVTWWITVRASDLRSSGRGSDSWSGHYQVTTLGKLFTPMCLCNQTVQIGTGQGAVMLYGWEGNRRSGVAPAMHHRLHGLSTYRLNGL